jgi:hypothetical protein
MSTVPTPHGIKPRQAPAAGRYDTGVRRVVDHVRQGQFDQDEVFDHEYVRERFLRSESFFHPLVSAQV